MRTCAIAVGVANVRHDPDPTSELVTQALLNAPAQPGEMSGEWTHVTLVDYVGWVRTAELSELAVGRGTRVDEHSTNPLDLVAIVATTHTPLFVDKVGGKTLGNAYLSTVLPLLDGTRSERLLVALPGGEVAWLAQGAASIRHNETIYPRTPISTVTMYARAFINVPYLWGGVSWEGIDCSGFVQLCYRMGGYALPRDGDQQHDALSWDVKRRDMQEGDLIFFGSSAITHVGLALNNKEYIHAEGQNYNHVVISSFDPAAPHYYPRLDEIVWDIKRVIVS